MEAAEVAVSKARGSVETVSDSQEFKDFVAQERKSLSNVVRFSQIAEKLNSYLLFVLWRSALFVALLNILLFSSGHSC